MNSTRFGYSSKKLVFFPLIPARIFLTIICSVLSDAASSVVEISINICGLLISSRNESEALSSNGGTSEA